MAAVYDAAACATDPVLGDPDQYVTPGVLECLCAELEGAKRREPVPKHSPDTLMPVVDGLGVRGPRLPCYPPVYRAHTPQRARHCRAA